MDTLYDLRSLDFMEQIGVLTRVQEEGDPGAIELLFGLLNAPIGDAAVDVMARNVLRALLLDNPGEVQAGLAGEDPVVRDFCLGVSREMPASGMEPLLLDIAKEGLDQGDTELLVKALTAMLDTEPTEEYRKAFLKVFRAGAGHQDQIASSMCIEALGAYKDVESVPFLSALILACEQDEELQACGISTWRAVDALARIGTHESLQFLARRLHHKKPTMRRLIMEALVQLEDAAIGAVAQVFTTGGLDERILAANVLGFIGHKDGCNVILEAFDADKLRQPNVRFAAYEALGRIPGVKSLVCLIDGLRNENDDMVLRAVVKGLEEQAGAGVRAQVRVAVSKAISTMNGRIEHVLDLVVSSRALSLFEILYADAALAPKLVEKIKASNDQEVLDAFYKKLHEIAHDTALGDAAGLADVQTSAVSLTLLAVDDSPAMRDFYKTAGATCGMRVTTAENGQAAWELLEQGTSVDVIVVDMNMPVMDGVAFTMKVRASDQHAGLPIIMATTESDKSQAITARKAGVSAFLKKPFTIDVLRSRIERAME